MNLLTAFIHSTHPFPRLLEYCQTVHAPLQPSDHPFNPHTYTCQSPRRLLRLYSSTFSITNYSVQPVQSYTRGAFSFAFFFNTYHIDNISREVLAFLSSRISFISHTVLLPRPWLLHLPEFPTWEMIEHRPRNFYRSYEICHLD